MGLASSSVQNLRNATPKTYKWWAQQIAELASEDRRNAAIFERAAATGESTSRIADQMARERLARAARSELQGDREVA